MASKNITTNFSNSSIQEIVSCTDWLYFNFPVKITEILVFSIILLSSLVGNTLIIMTVYKRPELRNTINYLVVNMAVSDFIFALTKIPVHLAEVASSSLHWHLSGTVGLIFCKVIVFMERISLTISAQSLVWIALDRFVAVVFPMKVYLISSRFRALAITSTWFVAIIIKSLDLYALDLYLFGDEVVCTQDLHTTAFSYKAYARVYTALFHVAPLIVMTILYSVVAMTLRRQDKILHGRQDGHQKTQRKHEATKMSLCIVGTFYICVLPFILYLILLEYEIKLSCLLYKVAWHLGHIMLCCSSATNPIICMTFVGNYRRGFKEAFHCCSKRSPASNLRRNDKAAIITLTEFRAIPGTRENLEFTIKPKESLDRFRHQKL